MTATTARRAAFLAAIAALGLSLTGCSSGAPEIFSRDSVDTDIPPAYLTAELPGFDFRYVDSTESVDVYLATDDKDLCLSMVAAEGDEPREWASSCHPIGKPIELTLGQLGTGRYETSRPDVNAPDEHLAERWESLGYDVYIR